MLAKQVEHPAPFLTIMLMAAPESQPVQPVSLCTQAVLWDEGLKRGSRNANAQDAVSSGEATWWLEYKPDWEKASRPWEAIMHRTAPVAVCTRPSCVKNTAGPRKPICAPR